MRSRVTEILEGEGTYIKGEPGSDQCKEFPVKGGDAIFIPGNVDHYTLNSGGPGVLRRIEVNPLMAAQSGGAQNDGGVGTGEPPVIRNLADVGLVPRKANQILTRDPL